MDERTQQRVRVCVPTGIIDHILSMIVEDSVIQQQQDIQSCRLVHHGAAAAVSGSQIVTWIQTQPELPECAADGSAADGGTSATGSTASLFVYASNAILNVTDNTSVNIGSKRDPCKENYDNIEQTVQSSTRLRHVHETLRCTVLENEIPQQVSPIVITCVVTTKGTPTWDVSSLTVTALVSGFSNGMIQVWLYYENRWTEYTIALSTTSSSDQQLRSITAIDSIWLSSSSSSSSSEILKLQIAAGTSAGITWYECTFDNLPSSTTDNRFNLVTTSTRLSTTACGAVASLQFTFIILPQQQQQQQQDQQQHGSLILLLFIGTAAPRNNKIHVYQCCNVNHDTTTGIVPCTNVNSVVAMDAIQYCGFLTGHEDWVTTLATWKNHDDVVNKKNTSSLNFLLASGSQDARIRLWKFRTVPSIVDQSDIQAETELNVTEVHNIVEELKSHNLLIDDNDGIPDDEFYDDIGESRLEIVHKFSLQQRGDPQTNQQTIAITTVTLEALLCGHEESVTSVVWHPDPKSLYGIDQMLISSSTDRTILLWSETPTTDDGTLTNSNYGGIWTPLSRVGSAGGILGGSIGSTLLGFCGVSVEPIHGRTLVGHAYGGALHIWDAPTTDANHISSSSTKENAVVQWKASPCITGHFAGISDCCWEAANGDYLLTVSNDQTCRLWAQLKTDLIDGTSASKSTWVELARPQVHGYNLSAVASLSTLRRPHLIVTGADEKEIRAFDAPKTTLRLLDTFSGVTSTQSHDAVNAERVERAYIPSLGLSNKASPADAAAADDDNDNESKTSTTRLPLERDLGAVSLWPEIQKLFGHNTEIYCLTAATVSRDDIDYDLVIVASSSKARDADDAKVRLWNVQTGQCIQVLSGGHRSTVATMSFSSNGKYLASSGKDRRLCLWEKLDPIDSTIDMPTFQLAWALDSAHKRIVWSVHFCPYESQMLASASRDGCIKIWSIQEDSSTTNADGSASVTEIVNFGPIFQRGGKPDAVTAISFAPIPLSKQAVLAVGLESGRIELWCIPYATTSGLVSTGIPYPLSGINPDICHCDTVTKLTWRPIRNNTNSGEMNANIKNATMVTVLVLASCSMDHGCRIFEIEFP